MPDRRFSGLQTEMGDEIMQWGCVLLKGGRGSRMGNRDKSELIWRGQTFGFHIRKELEQLDRPCFLSETERSSVREDPGSGAVLWSSVWDQTRQAGPMGGIASCLRTCLLKEHSLDGLFFVPCDMPFFRKEMAASLADAFQEGDDGVIWRTRDGQLHPVCGFYAKSALPVIESCLRNRELRMKDLCGRLHMRILDTEKEHIPDTWFMNINDPEAYEAVREKDTPAILAVSGSKNTGKTTLAEALVRELSERGVKVAVIKHDGHDFIPDVPGTDSCRIKAAGAFGTAVYSENRFCVVKEEAKQAEDFFACFSEADLILLEGQKNSSYPKFETMRRAISTEPVCRPETVLAYVTDFEREKTGKKRCEVPVYSFQDMDPLLELAVKVIDCCKGQKS